MCLAVYLCYYDGELPKDERPPAPGFWRKLGRDALWAAWPCVVMAAAIVASDWLTR